MKNFLIYRCKICNKHFILDKEEVQLNLDKGNYLCCPFRGHRDIVVAGSYDSVGECMEHISFAREGGRMKQKR